MDKFKRAAVIAGNWKMNKTASEAKALIADLIPLVSKAECTVIIGVPFTDIAVAVDMTKGTNIKVAAQNCHFKESGAYTGEISAKMLTEAGVEYVILGHSERRQYFAETDETVNLRTKAALAAGLRPIVCVGETLEQREAGQMRDVIIGQVCKALDGVSEADMKRLIIAYEPVWAIGTGRTATAEQANEVCALIRSSVLSLYNKSVADGLTIQYGGSMNAGNCAELLAQYDVDGGLIGGAALKPNDFATIVAAASK
ncbi:MAG: triose-phosphate isomerase [Oscillospiraceae bacterium]|nr:triose-phosphate isomerase [Oscillospiraceae bacterium]